MSTSIDHMAYKPRVRHHERIVNSRAKCTELLLLLLPLLLLLLTK